MVLIQGIQNYFTKYSIIVFQTENATRKENS